MRPLFILLIADYFCGTEICREYGGAKLLCGCLIDISGGRSLKVDVLLAGFLILNLYPEGYAPRDWLLL
jgi:hypothetical protein